MTKYADGRHVPKLGDVVRGIPENVGHEVTGEIIQLHDKAPPNCIVAFLDKKEVALHTHDPAPITPVEVVSADGQTKKKLHMKAAHAPADTSKLDLIWRNDTLDDGEEYTAGASEAETKSLSAGATNGAASSDAPTAPAQTAQS